jgi:hypothetical protein
MGRELPMPGDWGNPKPCTAPPPDAVDAVAALNQLGDRIPKLIEALDQVHQALPELLMQVLIGDLPRQRWSAMAALCQEPAEILAGLSEVCRRQAGHE